MKDAPALDKSHPDEEKLVCFLEGRLSFREAEAIEEHVIYCDACAQALSCAVKLQSIPLEDVPLALAQRLNNLAFCQGSIESLEIALRFRDKLVEIIKITGDVLLGQELVPAPVLRSRSIKDFKDHITILKDFNNLRVQIKIDNKQGKKFDLHVLAKDRSSHKAIKNMRISLFKDDTELESYDLDLGSVTFENILLGKYKVSISNMEGNLASVLVDIRI